MYKDKISLSEAMSYELLGHITIVDASPESIAPYPKVGKKWKEAFQILQSKYRHISPDKLLNFISAKYSIEIAEVPRTHNLMYTRGDICMVYKIVRY